MGTDRVGGRFQPPPPHDYFMLAGYFFCLGKCSCTPRCGPLLVTAVYFLNSSRSHNNSRRHSMALCSDPTACVQGNVLRGVPREGHGC